MSESTPKYISTLEMSHEDWLAGRKNFIGASESAAAIGLDKYKSPYDLWKVKTGAEKPEMDELGRQRAAFGLRAEDMIAGWLSDKYGFKVQKDNKIRIHPRLPFWSCNLDRVIVSHPSGPGALELKTTSRESLKTWSIDAEEPSPIFMHHWVQVQAQLAITGWEWGAVGVLPSDSYLGFGEPELIEIWPDADFIEAMEKEIEEFWTKYVQTNTPPPPKTLEDFREMYRIAGPPPLEINRGILEKVLELKAIKARKKAIQDEYDALDLQIKLMMGEHDSAVFDGETVLTFKNNMATLFDAGNFEKDLPEEAAGCKVVDKNLVKSNYPEYFEKYVYKEVSSTRVLRLKDKALEKFGG